MANVIPSRIGQINGAGDPLALFLKVYSGRVLSTFLRMAVFRERHLTQTIASGKSAQFPATGILLAQNHIPGDEIIGETLNNSEKVIYIEGKKIAPVFVADIDYLMNHYDYSQYIAEQIAQSLSKQYDQDTARTFINGARTTTPNVLGVFAGDTLVSTEVNSLFLTDGPTIVNGIYDAAVALDTRDVPAEDRTAFLKPVQYALAVKDGRAVDIRFNEHAEDLGGVAFNVIKMVANIPIIKTNNYPTTNDIGNTLQPAGRQHDYSTSQAIIAHKSGAGTVALTEMSTESWYDPRRQGNFMLGKYICGKDFLRPEASFELQSASPAG
jgi:hypothetical protein